MQIEKTPLGLVFENPENPRTVSEAKMQWLINSILVFPKMLSLRPVVINDSNMALGGNQRFNALSEISEMGIELVKSKLGGGRRFQAQNKSPAKAIIEILGRTFESTLCRNLESLRYD